jgi:hypothetical protein
MEVGRLRLYEWLEASIDMMRSMKRLLFLLGVSTLWLSALDLQAVHKVYILPMTRGLDQFLADSLTGEHIFEVVTNPKMAEAVFTDRIGTAFEEQWSDLNPVPQPVAKPETNATTPNSPLLPGETVNKLSSNSERFTLGHGRGVVFLVDPKTHEVIWSTYRAPKSSSPDELHRTASDIVSRLKRTLGLK